MFPEKMEQSWEVQKAHNSPQTEQSGQSLLYLNLPLRKDPLLEKGKL